MTKTSNILLFVLLGLVLVSASTISTFVPELEALETKFGSFESFVRNKADDAVKGWLDSAPVAFDTSASAWKRAIRCTKNLADNAAVNVFGDVAKAMSIAHYSVEQENLLKHQVFSTEVKKDTVSIAETSKQIDATKSSNLATFNAKLETCFKTQVAFVEDSIKQINAQFAADVFRPQGVIAEDKSKPVVANIKSGFEQLRVQAQALLAHAIADAASKAASLNNPAITAATLVNPTLGGSVFCGTKNACLNGGRCMSMGVCACTFEWTGPSCTIPVNPCAVYNVQCENGGICDAPNGQWQCKCPQGLSGLFCESRIPVAPVQPQQPKPQATPAPTPAPAPAQPLAPAANTSTTIPPPPPAPPVAPAAATAPKTPIAATDAGSSVSNSIAPGSRVDQVKIAYDKSLAEQRQAAAQAAFTQAATNARFSEVQGPDGRVEAEAVDAFDAETKFTEQRAQPKRTAGQGVLSAEYWEPEYM